MSKYIASASDNVVVYNDASYAFNGAVFINCLLSLTGTIAKDTDLITINVPNIGKHAALRVLKVSDTMISDSDVSVKIGNTTVSSLDTSHTHTATVTDSANTAYVVRTTSTVDGLTINTARLNQSESGTIAIMGWVDAA